MFSVLQSSETVLFFKESISFKRASSPSVIHLSFQSPNPEITAQTPKNSGQDIFASENKVCVLSDFFIFWSLCPKVLST